MMAQAVRSLAAILAALLLTIPGLAQQDQKKKSTAPSLDGTSGLFRTWDAETLRASEFNFTIGWNHLNRDPDELIIKNLPVGVAFGLADRFEVFGSVDATKRIEGRSIGIYRVLPGQLPRPATTLQGVTYFTNEAPFIDVPRATGLGDIHLGAKVNFLSERSGSLLSMGLAAFVKLPTNDAIGYLNRGLGTGEMDAGFLYLLSKTAFNVGQFHLNTGINFVRNPNPNGGSLADLQHEFLYRGGAAFPAYSRFQVIVEIDGKTYFGAHSSGLNHRSPVDFLAGARVHPADWISFGAAYRATFNRIREDPGRQVFPAGINGFVAQLAFMKRRNDPPTATCSVANAIIKQDETTTVRASAVDPDGDTLTYTWTTTGGKVTGTGDTVTFDATGVAPGKYTVTATVFDGKHQVTCSSEITVVKKNLPPTVECSPANTTITMGESATLTAKATDPNNDSLTYRWTVNGQPLAADTPSITFGSEGRQPGTYKVELTVSDGELTASCSITVTIRERPNRPPTIECLTTTLDIAAGKTAELKVRTSDPDNDKTTVAWSATGGTVSGTGETATFNATGLRAGTYTVTATVDDGRGGRASCNMTVNVSERMTLPGSFRPGSARLDNVAKAALDDIAVRMQNDSRMRANVIGYTDDSRRDKGLGIKRAEAVADYLRKKGIDASRLTTTDGGTSNPVADNKTAAGRSSNRRVEIEFTVK
jgi:outer membrane protein OmpA-like peptidoglycan-associated protein